MLGAAFATRLQVPAMLLFLALGMVIADDGLRLVTMSDPRAAQMGASVALVVILFEGGLTTKPRDVRIAAAPGLVLATVGVAITAAVVALGGYLLLNIDVTTAVLLGAVVASTDAAAVFTVLRRSPLPRRLVSVLELESGANDPMAIMLTIGALEVWRSDPSLGELAGFALMQLGGGVVVGVVVALAGSWVLRKVHLGTAVLYAVFALAVAGMAYGAAAAVGASGFLAVYVAGLIVGARVPRYRRTIREFHEGLASAGGIGLFLLLGVLVFPTQLAPVTVPALAVTAVLVLVARPLAVVLCLVWFRYDWRQLALVSWAGLRGAVPIVLATFPLAAGYPGGRTIFNVVFFVVLVSSAVQGATVGRVARKLGLADEGRVWAPVAEAIPVVELHDVEADIVEVDITKDLAVSGQQLRAVPMPAGALATTLLRDGQAHVPGGTTRLQPGDVLLVAVPGRDDATAQIVAWARGERTFQADNESEPTSLD